MKKDCGNIEFREKLQNIIDNNPPQRHENRINQLSVHSIKQIKPMPLLVFNYQCHMFTFKLKQLLIINALKCTQLKRKDSGKDLEIGNSFIDYCIKQKYLQEIALNHPDTKVILYFKDNRPTHSGIFCSNQEVISKWGTGNIFRHEIWEVPINYGDRIGFYKFIPYERMLYNFDEYCNLRGVNFETNSKNSKI